MWGFLLAVVSLAEFGAFGCYLAFETFQESFLFWLCVGFISFQFVVYYLLSVYFAFFSSSTYANLLERILNVTYLFSVYVHCMLFKLEPAESKSIYEHDGMMSLNSTYRRKMLVLHVVTVTLPLLCIVAYNSYAKDLNEKALDISVMTTIALALCVYSVTILRKCREMGESEPRLQGEISYYRDERFASL